MDRAASHSQTMCDLPRADPLGMQSPYSFIPRVPLRSTVTLLALQPRQRLAGGGRRQGWSPSTSSDHILRGDPDRGMLASQQALNGFPQIHVGWAASEVPRERAFSDGLPPNRAGHVSEHPALQCFKPRRALLRGDPHG